jgi:uncharacterized protein (DUF2141 family)
MIAAMTWTVGAMAADKGEVTIRVDGLRNDQGKVLVALSSQVPGEIAKSVDFGQMVYADMKESSTAGISFIAKELPAGTYYIYLFHDENDNQKLDYDGNIPAEGVVYDLDKKVIPQVTIDGGNTTADVVVVYLNDSINKE